MHLSFHGVSGVVMTPIDVTEKDGSAYRMIKVEFTDYKSVIHEIEIELYAVSENDLKVRF